MGKICVGLYMGDREYGNRFAGCLMNYFREQFEIHVYTDVSAIGQEQKLLNVIVISDYTEDIPIYEGIPVIYLYDEDTEMDNLQKEGVYFVEKYQDINKIVDEIMQHIGEEIKCVCHGEGGRKKLQVLAVYSLAENEYQLPFAVTLASILSETEKVLFLDLQENSGLTQIMEQNSSAGMEDLLLMAESGKYSKSRLISCIGHLNKMDVVYPVNNTECFCEVNNQTYQKLFQMLDRELEYGTIIINLGSRFIGFFELLSSCRDIYLMKGRGGLGQWREKEFVEEIVRHKDETILQRIHDIKIPLVTASMASCERLVEQWKWNDFGDTIRKTIPGVMSFG